MQWESLISQNKLNFCFSGFANYLLKNKEHFLEKKDELLKLGARKFHFLKYRKLFQICFFFPILGWKVVEVALESTNSTFLVWKKSEKFQKLEGIWVIEKFCNTTFFSCLFQYSISDRFTSMVQTAKYPKNKEHLIAHLTHQNSFQENWGHSTSF